MAVRALRRRRAWRQIDLAAAAGVSQSVVSLIELGRIEEIGLSVLRRVLGALDARAEVDVRWRGGLLDRLLDERHASLVEAVADILRSNGWEVRAEVPFALFGERGSIDLLAYHPGTQTVLLIEVKSELTSVEETLRRINVKLRVVPTVAREQLGWQVRHVARLLVLPDAGNVRRRVQRHGATFASVFPDRAARVRDWLRRPDRALGAIWFLPLTSVAGGRSRPLGGHRVRAPRSRTKPVADPARHHQGP